MILYACYTLFFLFLLLKKKGTTRTFHVTENDTKFILLGLVIYSATYFVSLALIDFGLKTESFRIISHHPLLLAICLFLYIKMIVPNDSKRSWTSFSWIRKDEYSEVVLRCFTITTWDMLCMHFSRVWSCQQVMLSRFARIPSFIRQWYMRFIIFLDSSITGGDKLGR